MYFKGKNMINYLIKISLNLLSFKNALLLMWKAIPMGYILKYNQL